MSVPVLAGPRIMGIPFTLAAGLTYWVYSTSEPTGDPLGISAVLGATAEVVWLLAIRLVRVTIAFIRTRQNQAVEKRCVAWIELNGDMAMRQALEKIGRNFDLGLINSEAKFRSIAQLVSEQKTQA